MVLIAKSFESHFPWRAGRPMKFIILRQGNSPEFSGSVLKAITCSHNRKAKRSYTHTHMRVHAHMHTHRQSDGRNRHWKDIVRAKERQELEEARNGLSHRAADGEQPWLSTQWSPAERASNCVLFPATREVLTAASR